MATWKLVSGIISIVLTMIVLLQSCAAGLGGALSEIGGGRESFAGSAGLFVALLMLTGGITSIATRNSENNNGNKALIGLFGLATLICLASMGGIYKDLIVWGVWCAINAGMAFKDMREKDGTVAQNLTDSIMNASQTALNKVAAASTKASETIAVASEEAKKRAAAARAAAACPNCGATVGKGKKFCPECGAALKVAKTCPSCGAELVEGKKFCGQCGAKVETELKPVENATQKEVAQSEVKPVEFVAQNEVKPVMENSEAVNGKTVVKSGEENHG